MLGLIVCLAAPCGAQGLEFEQVGDRSLDAKDLEFGDDEVLWASATELWELNPTTQIWQQVTTFANDHVIVLSADTVLIGQNLGIRRSINRGQDWEVVHLEGGFLFEAELDGPNNGVVLSEERFGNTGIAYSTDRGASFTESTFTVSTSIASTLETAVEIVDGPASGRLVGGTFNGIAVSEDGGRTWSPSSLFQEGRFWVRRMVIGKHPTTGERRLYATLTDSQEVGVRLYVSDDNGLTWTDVPGMVEAYLIIYAQEMPLSLLVVERAEAVDGEQLAVWHSADDGESWTLVGELPAEVNGDGIFSKDILIGPDERLYVSVSRAGSAREWVYRTTEPVVVANQPELPPPTEGGMSVYPNPATDQIMIEAVGFSEDVVLYDLLGREVRRARLVSGKAIDVSMLSAGAYVLHAENQRRVITIRR